MGANHWRSKKEEENEESGRKQEDNEESGKKEKKRKAMEGPTVFSNPSLQIFSDVKRFSFLSFSAS